MQVKPKPKRPRAGVEQRESPRRAVDLSGDLIVPAEKITLPCRVLNLSKGGASIRCDHPLPPHTYVILCLDGFGRLEGLTRRHADGEIGLQFVVKKATRDRAARNGVLRRHTRLASISKVRVTLDDGRDVSCEVIDVSMRGLCLRTKARPPVNQVISIGKKQGHVVRHHSEGIAVEFAATSAGQRHDD